MSEFKKWSEKETKDSVELINLKEQKIARE